MAYEDLYSELSKELQQEDQLDPMFLLAKKLADRDTLIPHGGFLANLANGLVTGVGENYAANELQANKTARKKEAFDALSTALSSPNPSSAFDQNPKLAPLKSLYEASQKDRLQKMQDEVTSKYVDTLANPIYQRLGIQPRVPQIGMGQNGQIQASYGSNANPQAQDPTQQPLGQGTPQPGQASPSPGSQQQAQPQPVAIPAASGGASNAKATRDEIYMKYFMDSGDPKEATRLTDEAMNKQGFDRPMELRKDLEGSKEYQNYLGTKDILAAAQEAAKLNTPPGDVSLIEAFQKASNPGMGVRPGFFDTIKNERPTSSKIKGFIGEQTGGGFLTDEDRKNYLDVIRQKSDEYSKSYAARATQALDEAKRLGLPVDNLLSMPIPDGSQNQGPSQPQYKASDLMKMGAKRVNGGWEIP